MPQSQNSQPKFHQNDGRFKPVFHWDDKRVSLIQVDEIDLEKSMKEKAKGTSIYELLERYGDPELIPGYGQGVTTSRSDQNIDCDLTDIPEFGTDILNAQLAQAEAELAKQKEVAAKAAEDAAKAKAAAEAAEKARQEAINKLLAEKAKGESK